MIVNEPNPDTPDADNLAEQAAAWGLTVEQFVRRRARKPAWVCYATAGGAWVLAQWCMWSAAQLVSIVDVSARQRAEYWACGTVAAMAFAMLGGAGLLHSLKLWRRGVAGGRKLSAIGGATLLIGAMSLLYWAARARWF